MWISILNYNLSQIEVYDIAEYQKENYGNRDALPSNNEIAESWLRDNGFNADEIDYMISYGAPEIYDGNTQNVIDIPL